MSDIQHAVASVNLAIAALWTAGTGLTAATVVYAQPEPPAELAIPCLRLTWLEEGGANGRGDEQEALLQLSIFVADGDLATARARAQGMEHGLGLTRGGGRVVVADAAGAQYGIAHIQDLEGRWQHIPDPDSPRTVHLARTVAVTFAGAAIT